MTTNVKELKAGAQAVDPPDYNDLIDNLAGGGSGTVATVTSNDATITVTNPTGPTVDLSAAKRVNNDTIWDTKGDLAVATGADAASKLAVGTNGQVLTADSAQATGVKWAAPGSDWTTIIKAADESVASSTTLQADDHLFFTTVNGGCYEIEIVAVYSNAAGGNPDIQCKLYEDAAVRGSWFSYGLNIGAADTAGGAQGLTNTGQAVSIIGTDVTNRILKFVAVHVGGGGTFGFWWAQSGSNVTPTIVRAGSLLRYRRIL